MFHSARIKLTIWYLLIIMLISVSFSLSVYKILTEELDRVERVQRLRIERRPTERFWVGSDRSEIPRPFRIDPDLINETKNRLRVILAAINFSIFGASATAGYFLAGRTLRPIKEMVDEQNRFVSDASHELRTPLTSLKSEIEVNLRDGKLGLDEARKLLKSNLEEVNKLQSLTDNLIKFTRHHDSRNLARTEVALDVITAAAVNRAAGLGKERNITIVNKTKSLVFKGNQSALTDLLVILLDNAIKYSPDHSTVSLNSEEKDGKVLIHVADKGLGIDKEDLPHIFERFYRADKSRTKSETSGFGLGLAIAKRIAESHCGTIRVQSEPGKGSVFTLQIPLKHAGGQTEPPTRVRPVSFGEGG